MQFERSDLGFFSWYIDHLNMIIVVAFISIFLLQLAIFRYEKVDGKIISTKLDKVDFMGLFCITAFVTVIGGFMLSAIAVDQENKGLLENFKDEVQSTYGLEIDLDQTKELIKTQDYASLYRNTEITELGTTRLIDSNLTRTEVALVHNGNEWILVETSAPSETKELSRVK